MHGAECSGGTPPRWVCLQVLTAPLLLLLLLEVLLLLLLLLLLVVVVRGAGMVKRVPPDVSSRAPTQVQGQGQASTLRTFACIHVVAAALAC